MRLDVSNANAGVYGMYANERSLSKLGWPRNMLEGRMYKRNGMPHQLLGGLKLFPMPELQQDLARTHARTLACNPQLAPASQQALRLQSLELALAFANLHIFALQRSNVHNELSGPGAHCAWWTRAHQLLCNINARG
jgi:hypothetical protein